MTYDAFEISAEQGSPVELYVVTFGSETPYRYTSAEDTLIVGGETYDPEVIKRTKSEAGPRKRAGEFSVELPSSNPIVLRFAGIIPGKRVALTVSRFHRLDTPTPEVRTIFDGLVESVKLTQNGHLATLTARPAIAAASQTVPREGYQTQCNNVLYSTRCTVDRTDSSFRVLNAMVDAVSGRTLTVSAATTFPDGWFTAGRASIDGDSDHRPIVSHVGDQIELGLPFPADPTTVTLYAGCAHTVAVCAAKFGNVSNGGLNFRGFAYVPTRNPFQDGIMKTTDLDGITL